jgi:uracil-DNA glycosylase
MMGEVRQALEDFCARPDTRDWTSLPFFRDGHARAIAERLDAMRENGVEILPPPARIFSALVETPLQRVKVVILGQDPYPTPGDAHGLAFSYVGKRRVPASLKAILSEMAQDMGGEVPGSGDLTPWAREGVLLLNTALTTEAGRSGAHLRLGWERLTGDVVERVSRERPAVVFMLWGAAACRWAERIDREKHLVLTSGHPSPLNRNRDFRGMGHFARSNQWLRTRRQEPVCWLNLPNISREIISKRDH